MVVKVNTQKRKIVTNVVSDETGQFDVRFVLWRRFCADNGVRVDSIPSMLDKETRQKWENLKSKRLA
jgi:hypothetical protein